METRKVRVLVDSAFEDQEVVVRAIRPSIEDLVKLPPKKVIALNREILADEITASFSDVVSILSKLPSESQGYTIKEVSFTLCIDSSGEVSLLSAVSGTVTTQVGLTFTLSTVETN